MTHSHARVIAVLLVAALVAGCAAGRAFRRGESAARVGDWDTAVENYTRAVQENPDNAAYQIALERARLAASIAHLDQARVFEARGQFDDALREYRRASEFDPPNRQIAAKVLELERQIRDQIEAARPRPTVTELRQTARGAAPPPLFNLDTVVESFRFNQVSLRDILTSIGQATGINVTFESTYQDRPYSVQIEDLTLAEALQQILEANQLFYKVVNQKTILVIPDNAQKRAQYEEQVVQTFYLSHADPAEIVQIINTIIRVAGAQVAPPTVVPNKTSNTIVARASAAVMEIIDRLIAANDRPRAEVMVDVQILEVNRSRVKQFGLDLGSYALNAVFSPEVDPRGDDPTSAIASTPFNANSISRGVSTADFYLAVPSALVRFLESDSETKVLAKPQLRGAEGRELRLHLGEEIPVLQTSFTPIAQGGANFNPLTSYTYEDIGVVVEMTPRVTYEGEIVLDLILENKTLGPGVAVADLVIPSFSSRRVETRLRLREGESTLLAGLLQENERKSLRGFPGLLRLPIIRQLFSSTDSQAEQTDIVMLLTPRIVRTHELTPQDVGPIYIGTSNNLGLTGPPPLIAPAPAAVDAPVDQPPVGPPAAPPQGGVPPAVPAPGGGLAVVPPGSTSIPGTTAVPAAAAPVAGTGGGQVLLSPSTTTFEVGGGPYTVPIMITGAAQVSGLTLTVTYNPTTLRLRSVQEGSFMRTGGAEVNFTQSPDAAIGRLDVAIVRTGDVTGVAGAGLLSALLFDAIGEGPANLMVTGSATSPGGSPVALQFEPVPPVTVR